MLLFFLLLFPYFFVLCIPVNAVSIHCSARQLANDVSVNHIKQATNVIIKQDENAGMKIHAVNNLSDSIPCVRSDGQSGNISR